MQFSGANPKNVTQCKTENTISKEKRMTMIYSSPLGLQKLNKGFNNLVFIMLIVLLTALRVKEVNTSPFPSAILNPL